MSDEPTPDNENPDLDRDEMHQQATDEPDRTLTFRVFRFLSDNFLLVAAVVGLGGFLLAAVLKVDLPRWLQIIGLVSLVTIPVAGRPTAKKVRSLLWDPNPIWIVDLDARYQTGAIYTVPSQRFREWSIEDGKLDWLAPNLCVGKAVDLDEQTIRGTWRGTLTDRELLRALQAVEECRGQLEDDAKRGFAIEAQAFSIIRNATRKAVLRVVSTFERGTLPDEGDGLTDEIDAAIEQFGLERKIRRTEEDDAPTDGIPGLDVDLDGDLDDLPTAGRRAADGGAAGDD